MSIKKLEYEDCLLIENIMNKVNELIDAVDEQDQRINRLWKFLRMRETVRNKDVKDQAPAEDKTEDKKV